MHKLLWFFFHVGCKGYFEQVTTEQKGTTSLSEPLQIIIPRANFTCNGRITGVTASLERNAAGLSDPYFELWQPTTPDLDVYNKVGEVQFVESKVVEEVDNDNNTYWLVNITLNDDDRVEFEVGDVIGYYHPPDSRYRVWSISSAGYRNYANDFADASNSINIITQDIIINDLQPLMQFTIGMSSVLYIYCLTYTHVV